MALGLDAEPDKGFATEAAWIAAWTALPQGYALMTPDDYDRAGARSPFRCACSRATRAASSSRGDDVTTMTSSAFAFLLTGVLLNAGAQLLLKAGTNVLGVITLTRDNWWDTLWRMGTQGHFVAGVACYVVSLVVWIMGLSRVPVSVAYPMLSLGYVINAVAAYYLFGEVGHRHALAGHRLHHRRRLARRADLSDATRHERLPYLPFARPRIDEATIAGVADVLRSGWITSGPKVKAFEAALSAYCRRPAGALRVVRPPPRWRSRCSVCGIGPGDEVITPAMTFFAAPNVIVKVGATPVFVDVEPGTRNIDLAAVDGAHRAAHPRHHADALRRPAVRHGRALRARRASTSCA